jgi:hypothetical protein
MAATVFAMALASASGSACGMTSSNAQSDRCQVIGGDKLPAETGGAGQICASIEAAAAARAPGVGYSVAVTVVSDYMLAARVRMADGKSLPEQKLAVSDRKLNRRAIDRFADAIGEAIGRASGG